MATQQQETILQARNIFAQQRTDIARAKQSAEAARRQLAGVQTAEQPSVSELLRRGQAGALRARESESQLKSEIAREQQRVSEYEKKVAEVEQQTKAQEASFESDVGRYERFEAGRRAALRGEGAAIFGFTTPEEKAGYRQGRAEVEYAKQKIEYIKSLQAPSQITAPSFIAPEPGKSAIMDKIRWEQKKTITTVPVSSSKIMTQIQKEQGRPAGGDIQFITYPNQPVVSKPSWFETKVSPFPQTKAGVVLGGLFSAPNIFIESKEETIGAEVEKLTSKLGLSNVTISLNKPSLLWGSPISITPTEVSDSSKSIVSTTTGYGSLVTTGIRTGRYIVAPVTSMGLDVLGTSGKLISGRPVSKGELVISGLETAGLGYFGYKKLTAPILTKYAKEKPVTLTLERIQPYVKGGKTRTAGEFIIVEKVPARFGEVTTKLRQLAGKPPKLVVVSKPQQYLFYTPGGLEPAKYQAFIGGKPLSIPIVSEKGIIKSGGFIRLRAGAKTGTTFQLRGGQAEVSLEDAKAISLQQQEILKQMAKIKTGGTPVSIDYVPQVIGDKFYVSRGGLETTRTGTLKTMGLKGFEFKGLKPNVPLKVSRAEEVALAKLIKTTPDGSEYWQTLTGYREATFPGRISSKVDFIKGLSEVRPVKDLTPPGELITIMKPGVGGGADMFIQKAKDTSQVFKQAKEAPRAASLLKATEQAALKTTPRQAEISLAVQKTKGATETILGLKSAQASVQILKPATKTTQKTALELKQMDITTQKQPTETIQVQKPVSVQREMLKVSPIQLQAPLTDLKLQLRTQLKTPQVQRTRTPTPTPTTIKVPPFIPKKKGWTGSSMLKSLAGKGSRAYKVQIRRRGQFFDIGRALPMGKALRLGAGRTKQTLAATFRLLPKGETLETDIKYQPSLKVFGRPKRPIGGIAFVERLGQRLSTRGEVMEIKAARRSKRRGIW